MMFIDVKVSLMNDKWAKVIDTVEIVGWLSLATKIQPRFCRVVIREIE